MIRNLINTIHLILLIFCVATLSSAQIKVACIGNSITSGYLNTGISYVPKLQELLGSTYSVSNMGVSGTTLLKNGDSPYWRTGKIKEVLSLRPDIITIKLGTNDTKPWNWDLHYTEFKKDYESLIDTLYSSPVKPKILLVLPVPVFYNVTTKDWGIRDSIIKKEIPIIKQIAQERGLPVIDAYTPLVTFSQYFSVDGIHPDARGADTIAHLLFKGIKDNMTTIVTNTPLTKNKKENSFAVTVINGTGRGIFTRMRPGVHYEITVYDVYGRMLHHFTGFELSDGSRRLLETILNANTGMRFVVIR